MKMYYAAVAKTLVELEHLVPKIGVLCSYFDTKEIERPPYCDSYFLDCGAFSAHGQGKEIDLMEYIEFCKENKDKVQVYASLDVIGDWKKSLDNYLKMREEGLDPLPALHHGEPIELIGEYCKYTNYMGLGGVGKGAGKIKSIRAQWMDPIYMKYGDRMKFHGFGIQETNIMARYPWKSVDGTFAHYTARLGAIVTPYGNYGVGENTKEETKIQNKLRLKPNVFKKVVDWVESLDISFDAICKSTPDASLLRCVVNIHCLEQRVAELNKQKNKKRKYTSSGFGIKRSAHWRKMKVDI